MEPNPFIPQRTESANLGGSQPTQDHHPAFESPQELMGDQPYKGSSQETPWQSSRHQMCRFLSNSMPTYRLSGVHIFACWVEMQGLFPTVLELLKEAILLHMVNHPQDSFPLLNHQDETLLARFRALFFAPLFGVQKLIEYDVREHALETVIGRSYQSSTFEPVFGPIGTYRRRTGTQECSDISR